MLPVLDGSSGGSVVSSSSSWESPRPMWLKLFDREGAGVEDGVTRDVMMLREFIVRGERTP